MSYSLECDMSLNLHILRTEKFMHVFYYFDIFLSNCCVSCHISVKFWNAYGWKIVNERCEAIIPSALLYLRPPLGHTHKLQLSQRCLEWAGRSMVPIEVSKKSAPICNQVSGDWRLITNRRGDDAVLKHRCMGGVLRSKTVVTLWLVSHDQRQSWDAYSGQLPCFYVWMSVSVA